MQIDDLWQSLEQYWLDYKEIIIAIIAILIVWIVQRILVRTAKKSVGKSQLPPEAANGLVLIIRMGAFFIVFTILTTSAGLSSEVIAISGFLGAAVGFASAQTISNIIAGMYVMITRPFKIGDYVRIGSSEGIVREIALNYTRIQAIDGTRMLVPNKNVINQTLRSYRRTITVAGDEEEDTAFDKTLSFFRESISNEKDVFVYPFDVAIHASFTHETTTKVFDEVCQQWEEKFSYPPTYFISDLPSFQVKYKFFITVDEPIKIFQHKPEFLKDILTKLEETKK